ncbi:MAG: NAD-dependent malic enzyme [Planctomycetota bacterium]
MTQGHIVPSASASFTARLHIDTTKNSLVNVVQAVADGDGMVAAMDTVRVDRSGTTQDITIYAHGDDHQKQLEQTLSQLEGVELLHLSDRTFLMHLGGKIEVSGKQPIRTREQLSMAYTPGVARVCEAIRDAPEKAWQLTIKRNTVAVVSDGTAVLGLGDIGPAAAMPVMEGKAQLFKDFAGVDAFPICLDTKDTDEIVRTVTQIAPAFGGINLEDISAPRCFEIEARLKELLDIPVFHDDQHGTAVCLVAAFLNAMKLVGKQPADLKLVVAGVGAAGTACTHMLLAAGVSNIIGCDRHGAVYVGRDGLNDAKAKYAAITNPHRESGTLSEVLTNADVFVGVSGPDLIGVSELQKMAKDPVVFAMANPHPEVRPELAYPHVAVMATGRSDYPNQINNVLCFPGIFKGALACQATDINEPMKLAAAHAIASTISDDCLSPDYIIPSVFDATVASSVAAAVQQAAIDSGVARRD